MTHLPSLAVSFKPCIAPRIRPAVTPAPASPCAFITVTALLFAASSVLTIIDCLSMSSMPRMPMPGGWSMSMMWMMMPGQTFTAATASFLTMWIFMMMAMMMPRLLLPCCGATARRSPPAATRVPAFKPCWPPSATTSSGPCSDWPSFRAASPSRLPKCNPRPWLARSRWRHPSSSSPPAPSSSPRGRRGTLPAAAKPPPANTTRCPPPPPPGNMASASAFTAASAAPI